MNWSSWKSHFEDNVHRPLPGVAAPPLGIAQHRALLQSVARFQLGESGEGRIAHEIDRTKLSGIDDDYRAALKRFIAEEGRHARILGTMVVALGGRDEEDHLRFHRDFFASQACTAVGLLLRVLWWPLGVLAALTVLWDHRATLEAFEIPVRTAARTLWTQVVTAGRSSLAEHGQVIAMDRFVEPLPPQRRFDL